MDILCKSTRSFDIYLHHQYWLFLDGETGTNHAIQLYVYSSSIKGVEVQCTKQSAYKSAYGNDGYRVFRNGNDSL